VTDGRALSILLVADYADDPRQGSAKVTHKLREELRAAGHQCEALFAADLGRRPPGRQIRQLVAPLLAARAARRYGTRYDVLDVTSAEGLWLALRRRLRRSAVPAVVCRSNGLEHLNYRRMLDDARAGLVRKPWTRRLWYPATRLSQVAAAARLADRLLVLNDGDRRFAVARGWKRADRVDVVPHGVSDRFLDAAPVDAGASPAVLFCGAWDHVKGIADLVRACDALAAEGRMPPLTVLGPGVPAPYVLRAFSERSRPRVTVLDRVGEDEVMAVYRRHGVLVFPSTYEGFGLVALEAMSQGLAVVATPVGCIPDLVRDNENGCVVPPRDPRALAAAIARLSEYPAERRRLGSAAARTVAGMSWRRTAADTIAVYRRALGGPAR
jgi:glycosyltransferase involved in cell wall biosynthesis